jgi:peptidoglycan-associated lipoprotein
MGISRDRMSIISYGKERPAVLGSNEDAWAKNRRAEFEEK